MTENQRDDGAAAEPRDAAASETLARADRGISPIAGPLGGRRGKMITLAAIVVGCGLFLAASWDRGDRSDQDRAAPQGPPRELAPFEPARRETPRLDDAADDPEAPRLSDEEIVPALAVEATPTAPPPGAPHNPQQSLAESARRAPVMAYSRAGSTARDAPPAALVTPVVAPAAAPSPLAQLRQSDGIGRAEAGRLPDRNLLITAGAALPCVLQTAMDSTTPGFVSCVLPSDVYSESGAVVLLERGTRVLGEYQGGLQQGRRRMFVLWTRAVTPEGVSISLASPAADALGRAGFDGAVDTRFWDRFGGALLLSLVDEAAYAATGADDSGSSVTRQPSAAANTALEGAIDIPATLRKAQGSEVTIFVAQDLDFRSVYRLAAR